VGEGGSNRESSLLPIGHLGVIYGSLPHRCALFFIAIRIWVMPFADHMINNWVLSHVIYTGTKVVAYVCLIGLRCVFMLMCMYCIARCIHLPLVSFKSAEYSACAVSLPLFDSVGWVAYYSLLSITVFGHSGGVCKLVCMTLSALFHILKRTAVWESRLFT
jgi:hypothetical protein